MSEPESAADAANFPSPRPALKSLHSTSLPSTPNHHPIDRPSPTRSPSTKRNASNPSPRAHHSASLPPVRKVSGGCKYETGMANAKRRVPYSLGPDKLDPDPEPPKTFLTPAEDDKLTIDMRALYDRLIPSQESEDRRRRLVEKLAMILCKRWPNHTIAVNVFGSTGNKLGTTESDVDICITTDCRELEQVCVLADFLDKQGMQRVVCISAAKVPIVKIWDPDLRLACDLNVNNPVALENTDMIRTYVDIDSRVRPLAMIIKYWTKRRVLNEAALGGTLSSYTWICMIINFLQTRSPPILPALQQKPSLEKRIMSGLNVAFDGNTVAYTDYGSKNRDSLGMLLFQFFRYYAHEVDFETSVMSVREGKVISKAEKYWNILQDNRLCVEEPFNTSRNLGNTADDTSVRGIHLELRRAFKLVSAAQLARCCDEYDAPSTLADEPRTLERQTVSGARSSLAHPTSTLGRNPRGYSRNNRQMNQVPRLSNPGRRASSASTRGYTYPQPIPLSANPTQAEMSMHTQQRQYLLHGHLFLQYQYLQAQEQELRAQLQHQALSQGRIAPTAPYASLPLPQTAIPNQEELMRARTRRISQTPLTAPIRPPGHSHSNAYGVRTPTYGTTTNPPSPLLHTIIPDSRSTYRRSSVANGSSMSYLRAQSQPPRPVPSPLSFPSAIDRQQGNPAKMSQHRNRDTGSSSSSAHDFADLSGDVPRRLHQSPSNERAGSEYMGYYLGHSPPLPMYSRSVVGTPLTGATGLGIHGGSVSPHMLARLSYNQFGMPPLNPELVHSSRTPSEATRSVQGDNILSFKGSKRQSSRSRSSSGPVVVNGSIKRGSEHQRSLADTYGSLTTTNLDTSASDDVAVDTPLSSDEYSQDMIESCEANANAPAALFGESTPLLLSKHRGSSKSSRSMVGIGAASPSHIGSEVTSEILSPENQAQAINDSSGFAETLGSDGVSHDERQLRTGASRLSPVAETCLSSAHQSRPSLGEKITQAVPKAKVKGKARAKKPVPSPTDRSERRDQALAAQPNGTPTPHAIANGNLHNGKGPGPGWQTQKRKSRAKRRSKSEPDLKPVNPAGGDFLPSHQSMRKGG